jgi:hypothetical protein
MRMVVWTINFSRRNLLSAVSRTPHATANCTASCPLLFCFFQILRICGWDIAFGTVTRLRAAKPSEWSQFDFGRSNKFFSSGPSRLPTNTFSSFLCPPHPHPIRVTCPVHLILLDWIILVVFGDKLTPWNFSLCNFLQPPVTSSHLGQMSSSGRYRLSPRGDESNAVSCKAVC